MVPGQPRAGTLGGKILGIEWLRSLIVRAAMMSAFGMFNALVISYSRCRWPWPRGHVAENLCQNQQAHHVPWVAIIVVPRYGRCALGLRFERLITLDIMLYGVSLMLEFVTLVVLRIRETRIEARKFRVPGGLLGVKFLAGVCPTSIACSLALVKSGSEPCCMNGLLFGAVIIATGSRYTAPPEVSAHPFPNPQRLQPRKFETRRQRRQDCLRYSLATFRTARCLNC